MVAGTGIVCLLSAATPMAIALTPSQLLQQCQLESLAGENFCEGYIAGAIDSGSAAGQTACIPDDISASTLTDLAVNALGKPAEAKNANASVLINTRLAQVFPCEREPEPEPELAPKKNWSNKERLGK
jgi:hypothetical protein